MKKSYIFLSIFIILLMFTKIYIANKLYLVSRKIQKNNIQINALKEERNILKLKIEKLKYKNTIIDPLFSYKIEEDKIKEQIQGEENKPKEPVKEEKPKDNFNKDVKAKPKPQDTRKLFQSLEIDDGVY